MSAGAAAADARAAQTRATDSAWDLVVVGSGAAGASAAVAAARASGGRMRIAVVDEHGAVGGPIWRPGARYRPPAAARRLASALDAAAGVARLAGFQIVDAAPGDGGATPHRIAGVDRDGNPQVLRASRLVLATGSVERFLPFPGWTLPGVAGVGGLQALVKGGLEVRGRRVVVAGSGPLLLALAAMLRARGARLVGVFEQAPGSRVRGFLGHLLLQAPAKLVQAGRLAWSARRLLGPDTGCWPLRADAGPGGAIASVTVHTPRGPRTFGTDLLACGFGLAPRVELAALLGCRVEAPARGTASRVVVDRERRPRTAAGGTLTGVWAAGEAAGVAGVDSARAEGTAVGLLAAGAPATAALANADRARRFGELLEETFALRPELRGLAEDDTVVCRCEDVTLGTVRHGDHVSTRDAKLKTRCGMGVCQGRVCGPALEFLEGWPRDRARPPLAPVPLATLAALAEAP